MKFHLTKFYKPDDEDGTPTGRAFDKSGADAASRRKSLRTADKGADPKTEVIEVSAKRDELLEFLNKLVA